LYNKFCTNLLIITLPVRNNMYIVLAIDYTYTDTTMVYNGDINGL